MVEMRPSSNLTSYYFCNISHEYTVCLNLTDFIVRDKPLEFLVTVISCKYFAKTLTHATDMPLLSLYKLCKHQKTFGLLMFTEDIEQKQ